MEDVHDDGDAEFVFSSEIYNIMSGNPSEISRC